MIFALREGLRANLLAQGFPVSVSCGPERVEARSVSRVSHRVILEHDKQSPDAFGVIATQRNPARVQARFVAYAIRLYAFDPRPGAALWEHEIELQKLVDGVLVALFDWCVAQRATPPRIASGRMLSAEEMQSSETAVGAGYVLQFSVGRSVERRTYAGAGADEAVISDVVFTARANVDGGAYEDLD
jgi:hypothetical protein